MINNNPNIEEFRVKEYSSKQDGNNGVFFVYFEGRELKVIASDGMGWDHVSVSLENRTPNWKEMCFVKDLFFYDYETVIQYHPKKSEYVNTHPYCLHLWRNQSADHELPPSILTGIKPFKIFTERDGVLMDDKAAFDYDYAHGEELAEKYAEREDRGFKGRG